MGKDLNDFFSFFSAEKMRGGVEELPINEIEVVAFEEEGNGLFVEVLYEIPVVQEEEEEGEWLENCYGGFELVRFDSELIAAQIQQNREAEANGWYGTVVEVDDEISEEED